MAKAEPVGETALAGLVRQVDPRAGPLIITIFGDSIVPRGGNIWIGSLIRLMAQFGLSERLVRTVVFRLARDGWFETRSRGRRSFYDLTPQSRKTFADADRRIYDAAPLTWDGTWTLVQAHPKSSADDRQKLRDALKWRGFGRLSPTLMVSPGIQESELSGIAGVSKIGMAPAVFTARLQDLEGTAGLSATAAAAWNMDELNAAYATLLERFAPFAASPPADPADCFVLRTLLIHEYRRSLLKDPQLPPELAPAGWCGTEARALTASLYRDITPACEDFIAANIECWSGPCPVRDKCTHQRFAC